MNNFFYDLNKRLASLADKQDATQLAESKQAETVAQSPFTQALNEAKADTIYVQHSNGAPQKVKLTPDMKAAGKIYVQHPSGPQTKVKIPADAKKSVKEENLDEVDYSAKKAAAGKDIGKPGKNFAKIAKSAGAKYGSKAAGERVAGAVLNKLRHANEEIADEGNAFTGKLASTPKGGSFKLGDKTFKDTSNLEEGHCSACDCSPCECNSMEESALQAYIGDKKYGKTGMDALRKAGREGASKDKMSQIRNRYNKMDEADEAHKETKLIRDFRSQGLSDKQIIRKMEQMLRGTTKTVKTVAKEGDMEEGNAFTAALKATPKGGKFKVGNKEFTDTSDLEEGFKEMDAWMASREKEKGTGKFDKRITSTGTVYTRKPETFDDPETDPEATGGAPARRGRPKGKDKGPERVTAKSYKYKAGRPAKTQENLDSDGVLMTRPSNMSSEAIEPGDRGEYDQEGESAKHDIKTIVRHAQALHKILGDDDNLPEWVQSKLSKIEGMMIAVDEYMQNKDQEVSEASKPDFLDLDKDGNKAEPMKKAAKEKKEEKVDETTVAGSIATAPAATKKSSGGYNFGGGVYESFNNQVESMITEGMNITVNMTAGEDGESHKSITVTAEGEEADQLAALLKMAGLQGQAQEACGTCGASPCGCEQTVDEAYGDTDETLNDPDWPTDTETLSAQPELRTYSGGLNGPKSTGQTTIPVVASQLRRQISMEDSAELERSLFETWKNYKG